MEEQAHCYWGTLAIGGPVLLDDVQMGEVQAAFADYGQQRNREGLSSGNALDK